MPRCSLPGTRTTTPRSGRWRTSTRPASTDVHDFFRRYYGPNNSVLTLVGDMTAEEGFAAAERYFGHLPASAEPARPAVPPLEPLAEPVRVDRPGNVPNDRLHIAFRLPVDNTAEFFAAGLAIDALGGLSTSRLVQRLVRREQVANAVQAHAMGFVDGVSLGFFVVDVADGQDPEAVEAAVVEELERFAVEGPPRSRWSPRWRSPSARGCRPSPVRRSGPT